MSQCAVLSGGQLGRRSLQVRVSIHGVKVKRLEPKKSLVGRVPRPKKPNCEPEAQKGQGR